MEQNLSLYKIFNCVAETGNISRAAKELYISQPAISKAISKLEQNLEVVLFTRNSRGVHLTDEGKMLYEHTKSAFETLQLGEDTIRKVNELGIGHIRIGVSTTLCKYLLIPYLKDFIIKYPHIKITIDCHSTFQTLELLESRKIDIGLIAKPEQLRNITFFPIAEIEDGFVATKTYMDNLKLRESEDNFDVFKSANLMLLDEENITRMYIDNYFRTYHVETNRILEVNDIDLLVEFAKIGLGVSCVIKDFVREDLKNGTLIEVPFVAPISKRHVGFAYAENAEPSESLQKFIDFFQERA
ncbi:LysR family transcriptional regulator [Anaerosporobacter sp.]|uniref:LysR family transcriptional regulator n=1 Tax=Anaerosporobacter sp. TaxID=1872529 RepID=UPI003FA4B56B